MRGWLQKDGMVGREDGGPKNVKVEKGEGNGGGGSRRTFSLFSQEGIFSFGVNVSSVVCKEIKAGPGHLEWCVLTAI